MADPGVSAVHVDGSGTRPARRLKNLRYRRIDLVDKGASHDVASGEGAHVLLFKRDADGGDHPARLTDGAKAQLGAIAKARRWAAEHIAKAERDLEELPSRIRSAFYAQFSRSFGPSPWIVAVFDADVIAQVDDAAGKLYYRIPWAMDGRAIAFDTTAMQEVEQNWAPVAITEPGLAKRILATVAGSIRDGLEALAKAGDPNLGPVVTAVAVPTDADVERLIADVSKAGKVVSAANLARLKDMHDKLGNSHKMLSDFIDAHSESEPADTGKKPAAPADTSKGDTTMTDVEKKAAEEAEAAIQKRIDEAVKAAAAKETVEKAERLKAKHIAKAASFQGLPFKADDDYKVFQEIEEKLSPEVAKRVNELFQAADAAIVSGDLFKAVGSSQSGGGGSAFAEIEVLADAEVAKGAGMTKAQAIDRITRAHPELYKRHLAEQGRTTA